MCAIPSNADVFLQTLENLIWRMTDLLRVFDQFRYEMENAQLPVDVPTAETSVQTHLQLRKKIQSAPVESLEEEGRRVRLSSPSFYLFAKSLECQMS
jgi:hypothetical protein